jgi:hypothetical protein
MSSMPTYMRGDYIKVEFSDETTGVGEWMWVRVERCDDERQLVFGALDNEPLNDYGRKLKLGSELAVSFTQIRGHKKPSEFR